MNSRRIILWVMLALSVFFIWENWQSYNNPPKPAASAQTTAASTASAQGQTSASTSASASTKAQSNDLTVDPKNLFEVDTGLINLQFDPVGAKIARAKLPAQGAAPAVTLLDYTSADYYQAFSSVSTTGSNAATLFGFATPFALQQTSTFDPQSKQCHYDAKGLCEISFKAVNGPFTLTRNYVINKSTFAITLNQSLTSSLTETTPLNLSLNILHSHNEPAHNKFQRVIFTGVSFYSPEDKVQQITLENLNEGKQEKFRHESKDSWMAFVQHYFVTAWVPAAETLQRRSLTELDDYYLAQTTQKLLLSKTQPFSTSSQLFIGPQNINQLKAVTPSLGIVVDYGFFTIIAKPLYYILYWINKLIGNWGWSILILTLLVRLLLFPLAQTQFRSMARMRRLGPRQQQLREQYKDDPQRLRQAIAQMYREEKVNPVGGCLPMLLQLPIFFALYSMLGASAELRGASWLYIHDLALPDPYYILPVIIVLTSFITFKMQPAVADKTQQRMFMFMPLIMGVFTLFFPSGVLLYWVASNLFAIFQQWYVNKKYMTDADASIMKHR